MGVFMPTKFRARSFRLLTVAGIMAIFMVGLSWYLIGQLRDVNWRARHTLEVIVESEEALVCLLDCETAYRGYLVVAKDEFLEPYETCKDHVEEHLKRLQILVKDQPQQSQLIPILFQKADAKLRFTQAVIAMRKANSLEETLRRIQLEPGKKLMDDFRQATAMLLEQERQILLERLAAVETVRANLYIAIGTMVLAMLAVLVWVYRVGTTYINVEQENKLNLERIVASRTKELSDSNAKLKILVDEMRLLTEAIPQLIWATDPDGSCNYVNANWLNYTGSTLEENIGSGWMQFLHPEDRNGIEYAWSQALAGLACYDVDFRLRAIDSSYRWFKTRGLPLTDEQGEIIRWFGSCTDVDNEKRSAELLEAKVETRNKELQASEQKFSAIFNNTFQFICLLSADGSIIEVNKTVLDFAGIDREAAVGKKIWEASWWRDSDTAREVLKKSVEEAASGSFIRFETEVQGLTSSANVDLSLKPVALGTGEGTLIAEVRDISELKRARDEALRANKLKSQFVANISHEIRTPLSGILGLSEVLCLETEGAIKETAQYIYSAGQNLMKLVSELLDFSKLEAGKVVVESTPFNVHALLDEVLHYFRPLAQNKGLLLTEDCDEQIPEVLKGDVTLVRQVLQNFVQNAIKFTVSGSVKMEARAERQSGNMIWVRFTVIDTGIGITEQQSQNLFQPFVQADGSTTRKYGGTGLGLAISKRYVELMGGAIGFESAAHKGSSFWFSVPLSGM